MPDRTLEFGPLLATAHHLADLAGERICTHFREPLPVDNKAGVAMFDPVTKADREAETVIREQIKRDWPGHGVIGEEFEKTDGDGTYSWVIDPIDGTRAFIMGYPVWGTLIGLMREGSPVLGMMDQPFTKERFWSEETGARYRGPDGEKALKTRGCTDLSAALLSTTSPDFLGEGFETERFFALKAKARMTRYGGDCYAYCMLAAGHIDLVVEAGLKCHDIMPLIPIIEGAGGVVSDWTGQTAVHGGRVVAAANKALHAQALEVLAG